jgi:hypothetical protein
MQPNHLSHGYALPTIPDIKGLNNESLANANTGPINLRTLARKT